MFEFAKEVYFDEKGLGNKVTRDKTLIRLLKSPAVMVSASGVSSSTRLLSSNPKEIKDKSKSLLPEKRAGNNFTIFNEEILA